MRFALRLEARNSLIQLGQGEGATIAQLAEHEARDNTDGGLDFGLVARAANARRQHDEAVMIGEILIGSVDTRLIARRLGDAGLEIIGLLCRSALCGRASRQPISASACGS
jgi:hypothetical protein